MALYKRNYFNLTEGNALSMRMGDLVPVYVRHMYPGDTFDIRAFIQAQFAPMQAPIMGDIDIKTWGFAVPYRLVWDDADEFFLGKNKKGDEVSPVFPRASYAGINNITGYAASIAELHTIGTLADYLDLNAVPRPTLVADENDDLDTSTDKDAFVTSVGNWSDVSMLEPRAYQLIYNEYFRDQNIDDPVDFGTDSYIYDVGEMTVNGIPANTRAVDEYRELMTLRKKRWAKDYFTSALPSPSLAPDVEIPVESTISLDDTLSASQLLRYKSGTLIKDGQPVSNSSGQLVVPDGSAYLDPNGTLVSDNASTIRDLTRAQALYQYLLDVARGGAVRIKDWTRTIFGVNLPDYRAMIPEYQGGGSQPVIISPLLQMSETNVTAQGTQTGHAVSQSGTTHNAHNYGYTAKEHTIFMVIACVMPKPQYMNGLPRRHFKFDKFDYFLPQFDHIGDQPILRKEITGTLPHGLETKDDTFGYTPRYADDKSSMDKVHGDFRYDLKYWTMARDGGQSYLNSAFLVPQAKLLDRPFFVQSSDAPVSPNLPSAARMVEQVYVEFNFVVDAWRPMSKKSTPIV